MSLYARTDKNALKKAGLGQPDGYFRAVGAVEVRGLAEQLGGVIIVSNGHV